MADTLKFTVYYTPQCPFSRESILLLRRVLPNPNEQLTLIDIREKRIDLIELMHDKRIFNHRTVPAIFQNDYFIGGHDQLKVYLRDLLQ